MNDPHTANGHRPVLYVIACGSPLARDVVKLVDLAQRDGWDVCVVTTPDGAKFVDRAALARQTGHPVRSHYKNPGDLDVLPPADAMLVCPATVNTVNKWAAGITDTLALGLLVEAQGLGVPIAAVPYTNTAMAAHPAFRAGLARLREWGVQVVFGDHVVPLHPPGTGEQHLDAFPWAAGLAALPGARRPVAPVG
ncbi:MULTISPECIES: flavoprotein [Micromonospora]|uniref:Flavoprotein n=1 Tax=Micromonospora solifontis TaxID=2487138 RepID=A0ABX9WEM8_9ACTN|nr:MULTISPECIES: flavoprotein [Micromonospora]NES13975.1 flavoprotein [Micromonospora sp. PPF5-17B]NES37466.1 flavoprotein [Micromonospora solifontis]NES54075.1 flavoprotein [Micromonospora sp. PPF5-6]RNL98279.1 flavoprotein [Micromonospora solifontis]